MGRYHLLISREKGTDLFKLEFKGALNKSVPFCTAKILGRTPDVNPGTLPPNKAGLTKPMSEVKVDPVDWGHR